MILVIQLCFACYRNIQIFHRFDVMASQVNGSRGIKFGGKIGEMARWEDGFEKMMRNSTFPTVYRSNKIFSTR